VIALGSAASEILFRRLLDACVGAFVLDVDVDVKGRNFGDIDGFWSTHRFILWIRSLPRSLGRGVMVNI
jgi:hypothetical protein